MSRSGSVSIWSTYIASFCSVLFEGEVCSQPPKSIHFVTQRNISTISLSHVCVYIIQTAIEEYKQIHPGFEGTRELKLIQVCGEICIILGNCVLLFPAGILV